MLLKNLLLSLYKESKQLLMITETIYTPRPGFPIKRYLLFIGFFLLSIVAFSQTSSPEMDTLNERLQSLAKTAPSEQVYLQTNKEIYETDEDLWFKAYLLDRSSLAPSLISRTLYLQVINEKSGQSVWNEKYEIRDGFADGHVYLGESLAEGDYFLAAYTGQSFYNDSSELSALCRIKVRTDMKPRIAVHPEFNRLYYNVGDTISLKLNILSEHGEPAYMAEIESALLQGEKIIKQVKALTDQKGESTLKFVSKGSKEGLKVDVKIKYSLKEVNLSIPVPYKKRAPIQFDLFPEGGNLVEGLTSSLAFKAVNQDGNPLDVEGTLFENNKPLQAFKSAHDGMGVMKLAPTPGKKYLIRLSKPKCDSTFAFPPVQPRGVVMQLSARDEKYLTLLVSKSSDLENMKVYLRGQVRGVVYCIALGMLNQELKIKIPINEFPCQGIAEFTLFNEGLVPLAERLVYVNPEKKLHIEAKMSKERYETREKASLKISVRDENGKPVVADLGVSVFDKLYKNPQNTRNILTSCLLSSEIKGRIYDPAYYFDGKNEDRSQSLDLLLLTQGWRNYVWSEDNLKVGSPKKPLIADGTEAEVFSKTLKIIPGDILTVSAVNSTMIGNSFLNVSDTTGRFMIEPQHLELGSGGYVYLKPLGLPKYGFQIRISDPFQSIEEIRKKKVLNFPLERPTVIKNNDELSGIPVAGHNVIKLPQVTIKRMGVQTFRDKFMGHLDSLAKLTTDYVCRFGVLNCPNHGRNETGTTMPVEGNSYKNFIGNEATESIVYHSPKYSQEDLMKMNNLTQVKGYYPHKEFYSPNYDKVSDENLLADFRNTLLWAPKVTTNEKGEATLEFFCSDINYNFVGKIEGVSDEGLLGAQEFGFMVGKASGTK